MKRGPIHTPQNVNRHSLPFNGACSIAQDFLSQGKDQISSPRREERIPTRYNNSDVYCQLQMFIINYYLNMFRASLCPSSGEQIPCITAYGVCFGGAGCGWLQLWGVVL